MNSLYKPIPDRVTVYYLSVKNGETSKEFISIDCAEASRFVLEVLENYTNANIIYEKYGTSKELFFKRLKKITGCI